MSMRKVIESQAERITELEKKLLVYENSTRESSEKNIHTNMQNEMIAMHKSILKLRLENDCVKKEKKELEEEVTRLKNEISSLLENSSAITQDSKILESNYNMVVNSKSWKLTQPIRNIVWKIKSV